MKKRSIVVLGGPDSGKTNFIGRVWLALDSRRHSLVAQQTPPDIDYVLDTAEHICTGNFAPRTEHTEARRDFEVVVQAANGDAQASIVIPDIKGELWKIAVETGELGEEWIQALEAADGAMLFVRIGSTENVDALNWVTSAALLAKNPKAAVAGLPTQVMLCELLRFLELKLSARSDGTPARISVLVAAWDKLDEATRRKGPETYLSKQYPLFAGKLQDSALAVQVFGLSVVGGDLLADAGFRAEYLRGDPHDHGWVARKDPVTGSWTNQPDLTLPIAWVVGF